MSKRSIGVGLTMLAVLGFGIAGVWFEVSKSNPRPEAGSKSALQKESVTDPDVLDKVQDLSAEVISLRAELRTHKPVAATSGGSGPTEVASPAPTKTPAEEREERREELAEIEASYFLERPDPNWARETVASIHQDVREFPAVAAALRSSECRSTSCRVEIGSVGDSDDLKRELPIFFHQLSGKLPTVQYDQVEAGDGKKIMVAYLSRNSEPSATNGSEFE